MATAPEMLVPVDVLDGFAKQLDKVLPIRRGDARYHRRNAQLHDAPFNMEHAEMAMHSISRNSGEVLQFVDELVSPESVEVSAQKRRGADREVRIQGRYTWISVESATKPRYGNEDLLVMAGIRTARTFLLYQSPSAETDTGKLLNGQLELGRLVDKSDEIKQLEPDTWLHKFGLALLVVADATDFLRQAEETLREAPILYS